MMNSPTLLVTGAAGYIGSHTVVELLSNGFNVIGIDNFSNSNLDVTSRIQQILCQAQGKNKLKFQIYDLDVRNQKAVSDLFQFYKFHGVIHFAGLKAVSESFIAPLSYWDNNVGGTLTLLKVMKDYEVKNLVFSSSALVYGLPKVFPIHEDATTQALSPYANTKLTCEQVLSDFVFANPEWKITLLRYFNPIGAHLSGLIGELPKGVPNNLMPFICQVAVGLREKLLVFGDDYETPDGTCVRDYIHVVDLAQGHVAALKFMLSNLKPTLNSAQNKLGGIQIFNFGAGQGFSVKQILKTFQDVTGTKVKHEFVGRRSGDVPILYADVSKAFEYFQWKATKSLEQMCMDAWRWQLQLHSKW
jgi:UDP-glucose 4-epimerase